MTGVGEEVERRPMEVRESRLYYGDAAATTGLVASLSAFFGLGPVTPVFFGAATAWCVLRCLRPRVRLRLTDEGIVEEGGWGGSELIRWIEVADVRPARRAAVRVELVDEDGFRRGRRWWKRLASAQPTTAGLGPVVFNAWALAGSRSQIVAALQNALDSHTITLVQGDPPLPGSEPPVLEPPRPGAAE